MKNQSKITLISFLGLIVAGCFFLFIIKPTVTRVSDLKNQVSAKKTELNQLEEQIATYKNSKRDLTQTSDRELIADSLLVREDLQQAIIEVELAAQTAGVAQSMVIQDGEVKIKGQQDLIAGKVHLEEVGYTLRTTSNFNQLINFLKYLEHLPHFTETSKISLQASNAQAAGNGIFIHSDTILGTIENVFFIQKK